MKSFHRLRYAVFCAVIFAVQITQAQELNGIVGLAIRDRERKEDPLRVIDTVRGSAAQKAGVDTPAYLLSVNGTNLTQTSQPLAVQMIRGPIGESLIIETTDFERLKTNKYVLVREAEQKAAVDCPIPASVSVTTNDLIIAKTVHGELATIQFLSFTPKFDNNPTATYRIRFAASGATVTNILMESYTEKRMGKYTLDLFVIPKPDHNTKIKLGTSEIEWSYMSGKAGGIHYDTNSISLTVENGGRFPLGR